jgi:hypothetical protein
MRDNAIVANNTASPTYYYNSYGGGVYLKGGTFTMLDNARISGNTASSQGGGVYVSSGAIFRIEGGIILGNVSDGNFNPNLADTSYNDTGAALYLYYSGATALHGTLNNGVFSSKGSLSTTDDAIRVEDGDIQ